MLKGIPKQISPELMHAIMNMGHGDEIVLADGNFPAASNARIPIRADGLDVCTILRAVMQFFPLDTFVDDHAVVMTVVDPDAEEPPIGQKRSTSPPRQKLSGDERTRRNWTLS